MKMQTNTRAGRAALSLIGRFDARFGRIRLAETLAGEPSERVIARGLERQPEFGIVGSLPAAFALLRDLEAEGRIRTRVIDGLYQVLERADRPAGVPDPGPHRRVERCFRTVTDQALFDRLVAWRNELAACADCLPSEIARLSELVAVVRARPRPVTVDQLIAQGWMPPARVARFGAVAVDVLAGLRGDPRPGGERGRGGVSTGA